MKRQAACVDFFIDPRRHPVAADHNLIAVRHIVQVLTGERPFLGQIRHHLGVMDQRPQRRHLAALGQQLVG